MKTFASSGERLAAGEEFVEGEGDVGEFDGLNGGAFDGEGDLESERMVRVSLWEERDGGR